MIYHKQTPSYIHFILKAIQYSFDPSRGGIFKDLHINLFQCKSYTKYTVVTLDQGIERENGCNLFAAKANDEEKACKATDNSTKDTTDASRESHVNGDIREQKVPSSLMKTSTCSEHEGKCDKLDMWSVNETEISEGETSQCVERKRIRVFSKALSQSVA
jgi:hypothetical protein